MERHALVVDDSPTMRQMIALSLTKVPDLVVVQAEDGLEAFRHLLRRTFDIIITDVEMPVLDGVRLVKLLKADPNHHHAPVVVVSGEGDEEQRQRLLAAGAAAYLRKPVQSPAVVATVKRLLAEVSPRGAIPDSPCAADGMV